MHFRSRKKTALDVSFDEPIETDGEGNPLTLIDIIAQEDTVLEDICRQNNLKKLVRFVNEIEDPREKEIVILRYGLKGQPPKTQNEIAKQYGISRSYVSRIETKVLKRLRKRFENESTF
ncbi:MAG: sigma-70 family RNA polymerase sigma factor [Clostridia bacterium]|nr:sigma-70 family RNA polymerase sigma factor [Clostridia bacterium]